jgi:ATP-dependent helicase HrpB
VAHAVPTDLPVEACIDELRVALAETGHAVLVAPPGAGKTTVVPLRLLRESWVGDGRIVVLEPRRLATRAAARRLAEGLGEEVGATVGYRTRDERRGSAATRIEVVTEGILTRRLQHDPVLAGTALVVFDELHERNLQTDLGLALALDAKRGLRPDLRILAMSATVDAGRVAALLGAAGGGAPAPVVTSLGRQHPVEVRWEPLGPRGRLEAGVAAAVRRALAEVPDGDLLVFLPGMGEIARVTRALTDAGIGDGPCSTAQGKGPPPGSIDVLALHGSLPSAEQDRALAPSAAGRRRVVLATDIAETSLTVAGVTVVVDAGLARQPVNDARTGMTTLRTVAASRASADQRAGRAGRTAPGVAYRLWSVVEHAARRAFTDPEITRVDLAGLALELAAWGVTDPAELPFPDQPPPRAMTEARGLLTTLGALDAEGRLTVTGRALADLPLHPRLARMVVDAEPGDGALAVTLAALLEDRDVLRGRPDDVPVDLAERVALLTDRRRSHPAADRRAVDRARRRAGELARRAGIDGGGSLDVRRAGRVLALAYPERMAQARGRGGRFVLRSGTGAWVPVGDALSGEAFIVAADVDGERGDARVRLAAGLDADDVLAVAGAEVTEHATLTWDRDRDDLVARVERRLGRLGLGTVESRPEPGPATTAALLGHVRVTRLGALRGTDAAASLRSRIAFLRTHRPEEPWPDLTDKALLADLDGWLAPFLAGATGRADLERVDVGAALRALVPHPLLRALDGLAPPRVELPTGRSVALDYDADPPVLAAPVQELYGVATTPTVAGGRVPVVVHLLSPAGRPVQVTADLAGFWAGTWTEVRKELAGRYPKHQWPLDPATATPHRPGRRPDRPRPR